MHRLARHVGLIEEIDRRVMVLKTHLPYHESNHVLGIAYNILCGAYPSVALLNRILSSEILRDPQA